MFVKGTKRKPSGNVNERSNKFRKVKLNSKSPKEVKASQVKSVKKVQPQNVRQKKLPIIQSQISDSKDDEGEMEAEYLSDHSDVETDEIENDTGEPSSEDDDIQEENSKEEEDKCSTTDSDEVPELVDPNQNENLTETEQLSHGLPEKITSNKKEGKQRYVVFVGNIPFSATADAIRDHFKKVGPIIDVRLATNKSSNKPKGFCFVEFQNSQSYERALSLHHSFLNNRRINVEYTTSKKGGKNVNLIVKKNLKLKAMQKQGKLEGSNKANRKRSVRRAKAKQAKKLAD